jgi:DME family drug/metabolite transporter
LVAQETPSPPRRLLGTGLVLLAAGLWGTLGTAYRLGIDQFGLTPETVVFYRAFFSLLLVGLALALFGRYRRELAGRDLGLLALYGVLGVTFFYLFYIYAVVLTGVTTAVVLLYTAPAWVTLLAWRLFGEPLTARILLALALAFLGSALVAGAYDLARLQVNALGILCGLGSAFTYALYSIFGKLVIRRGVNLPLMMFWMFLVGSIGLALAQPPERLLDPGPRPLAWLMLLGLAVGPTLGALAAYTAALRHLDAGAASIIATFEPLVAATLAFAILREIVTPPQLLGGACIIAGVIVLSLPRRGVKRDA